MPRGKFRRSKRRSKKRRGRKTIKGGGVLNTVSFGLLGKEDKQDEEVKPLSQSLAEDTSSESVPIDTSSESVPIDTSSENGAGEDKSTLQGAANHVIKKQTEKVVTNVKDQLNKAQDTLTNVKDQLVGGILSLAGDNSNSDAANQQQSVENAPVENVSVGAGKRRRRRKTKRRTNKRRRRRSIKKRRRKSKKRRRR